ncbi:marvel domain-containing protein [Coniella lustricola]|uniref:Marvel domain-containing protein n=1 Tax=Coniella lustricola TaxID=2025994 RepID=A0A2T3A8T5_9PEZI|nr:marvel domain-containing protein [Coniella lustricola]
MNLVQTALRALQLIFVIILTGLLGNVIAINNHGSYVSSAGVNFSMFVTVLAWLVVLFGLIASFVESLAVPIVLLAADGLVLLFTFIDAIVLAALLGVPNCGRAGGLERKCRELQASTAFMWFLFGTFVATLALAAMNYRRGGGGGMKSGPSMRQVHVGV